MKRSQNQFRLNVGSLAFAWMGMCLTGQVASAADTKYTCTLSSSLESAPKIYSIPKTIQINPVPAKGSVVALDNGWLLRDVSNTYTLPDIIVIEASNEAAGLSARAGGIVGQKWMAAVIQLKPGNELKLYCTLDDSDSLEK